MENILQNLAPGTWSIRFRRPNTTSIGLLVTEVEIAIAPSQDIIAAINNFDQVRFLSLFDVFISSFSPHLALMFILPAPLLMMELITNITAIHFI